MAKDKPYAPLTEFEKGWQEEEKTFSSTYFSMETVTVMKQEVLVGFRTEFYFTCIFLKQKTSTNWK